MNKELEFTKLLEAYVETAQQVAELQNETHNLLEAFMFSEPYAGKLNLLHNVQSLLDSVEKRIRDLAVEEFRRTGNKKPFPGTGIREMVKVTYEEERAKEWAISKSLTMLKLDKTRFEKYAKQFPEDVAEFAKLHIEIVPTISNIEAIKKIANEIETNN